MEFDIKRITSGPKHHLFGFHDLVQTNARGDLALSLEVEDISHPPLPGETCLSGVVPSGGGEFIPVHKTHTWNYPQGARLQWIGDSDLFTCNDRTEDGLLVARVSDARTKNVVDTLPFPIHCIVGNNAFFFNYDRIHAVGGYGYNPFVRKGSLRLDDCPSDDGLFVGDIKSRSSHLLVSLLEVAECGEKRRVKSGYPHYLTHAMLNPNGTRIAFLHRYRVVDGGETTRLMTIGADGTGLRCLAKGFLSHFTWISNEELFIWGEEQRALCAFRESLYLRVPGVLQMALLAKRAMRALQSRKRSSSTNKGPSVQAKCFLRVTDVKEPIIRRTGMGVLTEDGHPMASPTDRKYLISDTYPNSKGDRTLMFYEVETEERQDVGRYRMISDRPDAATFDWKAAQSGMDKRVLKKFNRDDYLFYRSGFHCDLHPRWSADGKVGYFDSIHEGMRQIYSVKVFE